MICELFECIEFAQLNRIEQLDKYLIKEHRLLAYAISKGQINRINGLYIQSFYNEKDKLLKNSNLLQVVNECHLKKNWNRNEKTQRISAYQIWANKLKQQFSENHSSKPTKEEMKHSMLTLRQLLEQSFRNSEKVCMKN